MNIEQNVEEAGESIRDAAEAALSTAKNKSGEVCRTLKAKSCDAAACADDFIRRKPLPVVAGALVFGLAVGYFAATRRVPPSLAEQFRDRFDDAASHARDLVPSNLVDTVASSVGRLTHNLKFW